jgi:hypothetical protein
MGITGGEVAQAKCSNGYVGPRSTFSYVLKEVCHENQEVLGGAASHDPHVEAELGLPVTDLIRQVSISERPQGRTTERALGCQAGRRQQLIKAWRREYNESHPHMVLGNLTLQGYTLRVSPSLW